MKKVASMVAVSLVFLVGCSKGTDAAVSTAYVVPPLTAPAPKKAATPEDWVKALESTYTMSGIENKGDGVTTFLASFKKEDGKNLALVFVDRDAFRKRRFFKGFLTNLSPIGNRVASYLSIGDNEKPLLLLAPDYLSKNGWLFMEKVSFLLDGEPLLEHEFKGLQVNRTSESWGVEERIDFVASESEMAALRKIKVDSNLLIRFTGKKGYANLPKADVQHFKDEIVPLVLVYDKINAALEGNIPPPVPAK